MPSTFRMNLSILSLNFPGNTQYLEMCLPDDFKSSWVNNEIHWHTLNLFSATFLLDSFYFSFSQIISDKVWIPDSSSCLTFFALSIPHLLAQSVSPFSVFTLWMDRWYARWLITRVFKLYSSFYHTSHSSIFPNTSGMLIFFFSCSLNGGILGVSSLIPPFSHLPFFPRKHILLSWLHLILCCQHRNLSTCHTPGDFKKAEYTMSFHMFSILSLSKQPHLVIPTQASFKGLPYQ